MENLLQVLKEATLFILTTQLFRHLLPGKKYLPYENVILSMAVLSMLIVPILSVADADLPGEFGERVALLETENEMFSQHLEKLEEQVRQGAVAKPAAAKPAAPAAEAPKAEASAETKE